MVKMKAERIILILLLCVQCNLVHGTITWSIPDVISSTNQNASSPQAVIDSQGNATAAWIENNVIKTSSRPVNGTWGTSSTLSNASAIASSPILKMDSSENVTALWIEDGIITSSILPYGGSWSASTAISNAAGGASSPALSVDAAGNAIAVWVRSGVIETSTRSLGVWDSASAISTSNSDNPQVDISANGTIIAVWHNVTSGADAIVSTTKTFGGSWSATKKVFFNVTAALKHNYPKVAIDDNGNAVLVWFRYNYASGAYYNVSVLTSSLTYNAAGWTTPSFLSKPGLRNPADLILKIEIDSNGNAIVFWTNSYDGQTFHIESSANSFGGTWGSSVMPYPPSLYSFAGDIAIDSLSHILISYIFFNDSELKIYAQESDIAIPLLNAWTMHSVISTAGNNGYPRCAISNSESTSFAIAVWINFDGINSLINAATGTGALISPPTNLSVAQNSTNLGIYNDFVNTISWNASISPNIQQYNIYRNNVYFASTDANTFQVSDHNAIQNETVTYGVAAQDNNYTQSSNATLTFP